MTTHYNDMSIGPCTLAQGLSTKFTGDKLDVSTVVDHFQSTEDTSCLHRGALDRTDNITHLIYTHTYGDTVYRILPNRSSCPKNVNSRKYHNVLNHLYNTQFLQYYDL